MPFWPKLAQKWILGQNFKNLTPDLESALPRYHVCEISSKTDYFDFFSPNLPNFKNLSPDSQSAPPRYNVYQFLGKTGSFDLFQSKFAQKQI